MSTLGYTDTRRQHSLIPFSFTSTDIMDTALFSHYESIFTEDFGPIKAGDAFDLVDVDFERGTLECYRGNIKEDDNPKRVLKVSFVCKPRAKG